MTSLALANFESYIDALPSGHATCETVHAASASVLTPPSFMLGLVPHELTYVLSAEFDTGPIRLYTLRDARLTFDGVVIHGNTALHTPSFNHPDYHVRQLVTGALGGTLSRPIRRIEDRAVMLSGPGHPVYGHWLIDMLPRLWVIHACGLDPSTLRYVIPAQHPAFVPALLAQFGIAAHQLILHDEQTEILEIGELILPTNLRRGSRMHASLGAARDLLLARAAATAPWPSNKSMPRRLFISRRNADPSRSLVNRQQIEDLAQKAGYALVTPEAMPIGEQIALFRGAKEIIGEYGSGLHNALFSLPGTIICALRGSSIHPGFIQSGIADCCGHKLGYVLTPTPINAVDQVFAVPERDFVVAMRCMKLLRALPG